jgi:hypothetical protein
MSLFAASHWALWALWAVTFATGAIVHGGRIYMLGRRAQPHLYFEAAGLLCWAGGCVMGGMQAGTHPIMATGTLLPWMRFLWTVGSLLLLSAGISYMHSRWSVGRGIKTEEIEP